MSDAKKGKPSSFKGKHLSESAKQKVREANHEKVLEIGRRHEQNNREKRRAKDVRYWNENREKCLAKIRTYYQNNREREIERQKKYAREHMPEVLIRQQNRRARKKENGGKLSKCLCEKLLVLQQGQCVVCRSSLKDGYHIDHIMPLVLKGKNEDHNIQLLCPTCNLTKHSKHPIDFMQSRGFLI